MKHPKSILITGASSGIGAALAETYAGEGMLLALGGRDTRRLDAVADRCRAKGAVANVASIDVTDRDAIAQWVSAADAAAPLDLVIANAAVTGGLRPGNLPEDLRRAQRLLTVNLFGALNTIHPAMDLMIPRQRGQVALVSSLAGYRGLPYSPAYSASKAAMRVYAEALRSVLARHNVTMSIVCPGFVDTPLNETIVSPKPFMIDAQKAASLIKRKLARGKRVIGFPLPLYLLTLLNTVLPRRFTDYFLARMHVTVPQTDVGPDNAVSAPPTKLEK